MSCETVISEDSNIIHTLTSVLPAINCHIHTVAAWIKNTIIHIAVSNIVTYGA